MKHIRNQCMYPFIETQPCLAIFLHQLIVIEVCENVDFVSICNKVSVFSTKWIKYYVLLHRSILETSMAKIEFLFILAEVSIL